MTIRITEINDKQFPYALFINGEMYQLTQKAFDELKKEVRKNDKSK